jgi:hypothetical protein
MEKIKILFIVLSLFLLSFNSCSNSSSDSENKLTLGTGIGRGIITGITDIFSVDPGKDGVVIQFMLESKNDMSGGYTISILIEQLVDNKYIFRRLFDYGLSNDAPQFYYINSFYHIYGSGSFVATGLVGDRIVAKCSYTVK